MQYDIAQINRLGNRANNQDRCGIAERDDHILLLVADGMGGHERGELAAQEMVVSMTTAFQRQKLPIEAPIEFLQTAMANAHNDVVALGERQDPPIYPRTTGIAGLVINGIAYWVHIGDSRLYLIRDKQILARTRDHTYVEDLYNHNAISEAEMLTHPLRNIVTFCLGGPDTPPVATAGETTHLRNNDLILLCSDGLWGALNQENIVRGLEHEDLNKALAILAEQAEQASYPYADNITAVAVRLRQLDTSDSSQHRPSDKSKAGQEPEKEDDPTDTEINTGDKS